MSDRSRILRAAAAVILLIAAAVFLLSPHDYLVLRDRDTGRRYARYPLREGEEFCVEFKHSVNLSPVIDVYRIEEGEIYVEQTVYYHFGAGVQTQLNEGETLTYTDDGAMAVGNIHQKRSGMTYIVGTVYDHVLTVHDRRVSLSELCGRNAPVRFTYEFQLF